MCLSWLRQSYLQPQNSIFDKPAYSWPQFAFLISLSMKGLRKPPACGIIDLWIKNMKISQDLEDVKAKLIPFCLTAEGDYSFIARYRATWLVVWMRWRLRLLLIWIKSLTNLNDRKEAVLAKIQEQGKLTKNWRFILVAEKLADVEELYLYKEKSYQGNYCREVGLFPLARLILQNIADLY